MGTSKICLLGASGYIGREVIKELKKGYKVYAPPHAELDVLKPETIKGKLKGCSLLINLSAGLANKNYAVHTTGTKNIVNECKKEKIPIIQISTTYTETDPLTEYSKSKFISEEMVMKSSLPYHIIRLPHVYNSLVRELWYFLTEPYPRPINVKRIGKLIRLNINLILSYHR